MKQLIYVVIGVLAFSSVSSQNLQLYDPVANRTYNTEKYTDVRGVPFLFDKWMKAVIYIDQGFYEGLEIKYDLFDNKLYFNKNDESFELQENVLKFTLFTKPNDSSTAIYFKKGFKGSGLNADQFVQVLVDGNIKLLKSDIKSLTEMSEINAGMVKTFATTTRYYVVNNTGIFLVRLNKNELFPYIQDKMPQLQNYINEKGLNLKKDSDLINLLKFYNSL
jgi:hypothetical protein